MIRAVTLMALLFAFETIAQEAVEDAAPEHGIGAWFTGEYETSLDFERSNEDSDLQLDDFLSFTMQPPEKEKLRLRGALWTTADLDGRESETSTLRGINDSYSESIRLHPLYLYFEGEDLWRDSTLRLGRFRVHENPVHPLVDGAYFRMREKRWDGYAFVGMRASLYDSDHHDPALGGGIGLRPWRTGRIALDTYYSNTKRDEDEVILRTGTSVLAGLSFPRRVRRELDSRLIAVSFAQQLSAKHQFDARYSWYGGASDELRATFSGVFSKREIVYEVSWRQRLDTLGDRTNDATGYYRILGTQEEYREAYGALHIPLTLHHTLSLEAQSRNSDARDEFTNRDFLRYAATLMIEDWFPDTDLSLALARWEVEGGEGTWSVTGDVEKSWERWKMGLGADFARYQDRYRDYDGSLRSLDGILQALIPGFIPRFTLFTNLLDAEVIETHENVWTFFARAEFTRRNEHRLSMKMTHTQDDSPESPYWRFETAYAIPF